MKTLIRITAAACLIFAFLIQDSHGRQTEDLEVGKRLAQTGMAFLNVSLGARSAAMGDALTAQEGNSISMFYNPAGMASMENFAHVSIGQVQWIGSVEYHYASAAIRPLGGRYGTFGLFLTSVDYGEFIGTIRADNERGYEDTGTFGPSGVVAGLGYATSLSDRFSIGANVKYARQSLGESIMRVGSGGPEWQDNAASTVAYDFGVLYRTGFQSLNFAFSARNFSREISFVKESLELPLTFRLGVSMDLIDLTQLDRNTHSLLFAIDAEHPRDYVEQIKVGAEYVFLNTIALRAGHVFPSDEQGINLGAGISTTITGASFGFDYSYTQFGVFGSVNRISLHLGL